MDNRNYTFDVQPVSPLDFCESNSLVADGISVEPQPHCLKLAVRGEQDDAAFAGAVNELTGLELPLKSNTLRHDEASCLIWLGPDEWQWHLSADRDETAEALVKRFRHALKGVGSSIVDVSDYYSVIRLEGHRVFDVLAKGSPLDMRRQLAVPGMCAQTRFGHASVLLIRRDDVDGDLSVDVQVRWSFAEYLWLFFTQALLEFQDEVP